jgi:hypothetical protein
MSAYWRIVQRNPPTQEDFQSFAELKIGPSRPDPYQAHLMQGISVYDELHFARDRAERARPAGRLGRYLARLELDAGAGVVIEKSGSPGHFTIFADKAVLLAAVVEVVAL